MVPTKYNVLFYGQFTADYVSTIDVMDEYGLQHAHILILLTNEIHFNQIDSIVNSDYAVETAS